MKQETYCGKSSAAFNKGGFFINRMWNDHDLHQHTAALYDVFTDQCCQKCAIADHTFPVGFHARMYLSGDGNINHEFVEHCYLLKTLSAHLRWLRCGSISLKANCLNLWTTV